MFNWTNGGNELNELAWSVSGLAEAIEQLARKANFRAVLTELPKPPENLAQADDERLGQWIDLVASSLSLEAEPIETPYADVETFIRQAGPALFRVNADDGSPRFLAVLKGNRWWISLIGPDLSVRRVRPQLVRQLLCRPLEADLIEPIELLLSSVEVQPESFDRARDSILLEQLSAMPIRGCWLLRLTPGENFWHQLRHGKLILPTVAFVSTQIMTQLLLVISWWVIGLGTLRGHFEWAWLWAWALLLLTNIPLEMVIRWGQSLVAIRLGALFKRRLLYGTLRLDPEEVRHLGTGQFMSRVMESESVELLALGGGFSALVAVVELGIAAMILLYGPGGWLHAVLLIACGFWILLVGWRYYRRSRSWLDIYRAMTNDLVERMVGHRTRLAQEMPHTWHEEEDQYLARYLTLSERLDSIGSQLDFLPRFWLVIGLTGLGYTFIANPTETAALAVSLGGVVLGYQALGSLIGGFLSLIGFVQAWEQVGPIFQAAGRPTVEPVQAASFNIEPLARDQNGPPLVLEARDLFFRYRAHGRPVLQDCDLKIRQGDRLLLEGPSGGGKSTLVALLTGLRRPISGLLLLWGFDRKTIGSKAWRQRVVSAPQFHENHVLTETFAFNLLMGRGWPAKPEDMAEAEAICRELGLGDLLDRMPAGFQQMVGESGWQLSHGERSRLFIARTLLQQADVVVLDESFAALDPENLRRALQCVLRRAQTVMVIAHP